MKHLFAILAAVIFAAGLGFAQSNTATVTQTVNESQATANQTGSTNTAAISQTGSMDYNDAALINQTGDHNTAGVTTVGSYNSVQYDLIHSFGYGVYTFDLDGITQTGNLNSSTVNQSGSFQWTGISQLSNSNTAEVSQSGSEFFYSNTAGIIQSGGDLNSVTILQDGIDGESYVLQHGGSNTANVQQHQNIGGFYYGGLSEVVQDGSNNSAVQNQTGSLDAYDGSSVVAQVFQVGSTNFAVQYQNGGSNTSMITSIGTGNGVLGDEIKTDQTGTGNSASIEEGLLSAVNSNLASVLQTGDMNSAAVSHEGGNSNIARVSQTSDSNTANVSQVGSNNSASVAQH